ncbi:MAG TPA: DUF1294 domain-containing protein [bacterium]|nr:DUF1294 domain-containing protein [bacterium]HPL95438.1 DUF1294 domain-containing protein [bacterium]
MLPLFYYLIFINLVTFIIFLFDKLRALNHGWRLPEWGLLILAALGGSIGGLLAMQLGRHKTQKQGFFITLLLIFICQLYFIYLLADKYFKS